MATLPHAAVKYVNRSMVTLPLSASKTIFLEANPTYEISPVQLPACMYGFVCICMDIEVNSVYEEPLSSFPACIYMFMSLCMRIEVKHAISPLC